MNVKKILKSISERQVVIKSLDDISPYPYNVMKHSDYQIKLVSDSIERVGWTNPILVDENNEIIAGHCRAMAAHRLGLKEVPCIVLDDLDESQKRGLRIADNQLARMADFDDEFLKLELTELSEMDYDLGSLGFDEDDLLKYLPEGCFDNELGDQGKKEKAKKHVLEIEFPDVESMNTCFNEFLERGFIVRVK